MNIFRKFQLLLAVLLVASPAFAAPAPDSFAPLVDQLTPAVVNISTTQKIKSGGMIPGMGGGGDGKMDEQLREFFERMLPPGMNQFDAPMEQEAQSLGSGFIIDAGGYVVTNNHVIAEATEITVSLQGGAKLAAEIVGRDTKTDLALLKVKSDKPLPFVKLGDSDASRVGDWVIAIGNPFGLGGTVTAGIISARARNINAGPFDDFIQTDASINRGNSGGPLFNTNGEVIGINTAIFSPSGGSIGIGFAVPTALAKPVLAQLREHGRTFRGWLGVKIQTVSDEIAESMGLGSAKGALVAEVNKDGPAEKAGIIVGDVIVKFDGREVQDMQHLPRMVAETKIGKKVDVTVFRDGKEKTYAVDLGELQEGETEVAETGKKGPDAPTSSYTTYETSGMSLAETSAQLKRQFGLGDEAKGLVVADVLRIGEAAKQGINPGDLIIQVNDAEVTTLDQFKDAMKIAQSSGRKNALLRVMRGENLLFITLSTEAEKAKEEKKEEEKKDD